MTRSLVLGVGLCLLCSVSFADTPKKDPPHDPFASRTPPKPNKAEPGPSGYAGLGAESVTPELIAQFAPQPLEERVSRKIQAMLDVRGAGSGILTSKGDRMVYTTRVTGTSQVWRQDGPMKYPVQLTGGEDRTGAVAITRDDKWLVISRDVGGQENPGLYLMSIEGGPLKAIQHLPKVQTSLQFLSEDGKSLYFRSNDKDPASYAIYRYDLVTATKDVVFDMPGLWSVADHKGDTWLLVKELGSSQVEVYQYEVASKKLTPLLGQNEVEEYDVSFGARPGQVLVRTNKLGDFQRLFTLEAGKLTPITPDVKHDIEGYSIDEARTRIYYRINEDGFARLSILDAKTLKPIAVPKLPAADNVYIAGISRNGRFAQISYTAANLVPQTVTYDWQTRKRTTWQLASTPEIETTAFTRVTLEYYPARDGTKIPMFVRRPASCTGPCPVVVDFHGGPEGQSTAGFSGNAQLYVDAGFVYVQPNVRGSTGYGKAWLHSDDGPKRLAVVTDIEDCAKYIRASWGKDGRAPKIGIMGGSYGGYSTLMGMTYFAGAYDAGVENVGISNLSTFLMNTAPYRRILRISEYGDPVKDKEALVQLSPITHVAKIKAPLMLIQGVNDPRVPVGEAIQIYRELERRKIPGGLMLFADEGHGAAKRGNIVMTIGHTIAFFEKHLKN
ncbi:S9 family peptidase [soil metagenome]